jgi:membrane fusion protein (multidrug efflux system)
LKKRIVMATFFTTVLLGSAGISYAAFSQREPLREHINDINLHPYIDGVYQQGEELSDNAIELGRDLKIMTLNAGYKIKYTAQYNWTRLSAWADNMPPRIEAKFRAISSSPERITVPIEKPPLTLSEMKAKQEWDAATQLAAFEPANGAEPPEIPRRWTPDQQELTVEAVLVPRQVTVISSSQDGKIRDIFVGQGDRFKKGDVLIQYDCADLEAEADIAGMQKDLTAKKSAGGDELFKLDIISDVDRLGVQIEDKQASSRIKLYKARLEHCRIRAQFNGRVTNRLANPGEYTRTDRVLMEVASDEPLQVEFMIPSKWLRWVNTGAPLQITVNETDASYPARISRIYGEVDPVSQSIQMIAMLETYNDPLLPGMSGQVKLSISEIEKAGVKGYLQSPVRP